MKTNSSVCYPSDEMTWMELFHLCSYVSALFLTLVKLCLHKFNAWISQMCWALWGTGREDCRGRVAGDEGQGDLSQAW